MPGRRGEALAQDRAAQRGVAVVPPPHRQPGPVSPPVLTEANLAPSSSAAAAG
ncbi:hypothetical protein AB5J52_43135 [Streptomyces sp. R39]|uniref:Uncharacterized protein n=1 Tax=Streptomyces sp. R39 TaxID=3238631 RepID=A0AB39R206_9ACTN